MIGLNSFKFQHPDLHTYQSTAVKPTNQSNSNVMSTSPETTGNNPNTSTPDSYSNHSLAHLRYLAAGPSGNTISFESNSPAAAAASSSSTRDAGKASKRKRTRESRKNPTTLFNTDPQNFRAMVQRYTCTGGSAAPGGDGGGVISGSESLSQMDIGMQNANQQTEVGLAGVDPHHRSMNQNFQPMLSHQYNIMSGPLMTAGAEIVGSAARDVNNLDVLTFQGMGGGVDYQEEDTDHYSMTGRQRGPY